MTQLCLKVANDFTSYSGPILAGDRHILVYTTTLLLLVTAADFFEVEKITCLRSNTVIQKLKAMFARFGGPQTQTSDKELVIAHESSKTLLVHGTLTTLQAAHCSHRATGSTPQSMDSVLPSTEKQLQPQLGCRSTVHGWREVREGKSFIMTGLQKHYLSCLQ